MCSKLCSPLVTCGNYLLIQKPFGYVHHHASVYSSPGGGWPGENPLHPIVIVVVVASHRTLIPSQINGATFRCIRIAVFSHQQGSLQLCHRRLSSSASTARHPHCRTHYFPLMPHMHVRVLCLYSGSLIGFTTASVQDYSANTIILSTTIYMRRGGCSAACSSSTYP